MENDKKAIKKFYDVSDIDIRPLLNRDFLELSIKAISSANPNRNNSWFTVESLEKAKPNFVNKPILGYFGGDDFESHNGVWKQDSETGMDYWDTIDVSKGERPLGIIRESDEIKIVEGADGLSWLCVTCVLWTQYSYKQVKRLLKDAKRAMKEGGAAKNVSVEVDILDSEKLPNGVLTINAFNLVGITILGSRNGRKIEPGIENAELSVIDIMGKDFYEKEERKLRLAYERLDDSENNSKEGQAMDGENVNITPTENSEGSTPTQAETSGNTATFEGEGVCPDCGKNPCECSCGDKCNNAGCDCSEGEGCAQEEETAQCGCGEGNTDLEDNGCNACNNEAGESATCEEGEGEADPEDDDEGGCGCGEEGEGRREDEGCGNAELEAYKCKYSELESKYNEVCAQLEARADYEELKNKVRDYELKEEERKFNEFLGEVKRLLNSTDKLSEEQKKTFYSSCSKQEITSLEDLKSKVAVAVFDATAKSQEQQDLNTTVYTPSTSYIDASTSKKDKWARMRENVDRD